MLSPARMEKVTMAFLSEDRERVIGTLQEQGVLEVKEVSKTWDFLNSVNVDVGRISSLFLSVEKLYRDFEGFVKKQGLLETLLGERFERKVKVRRGEIGDICEDAEKVIAYVEGKMEEIGKEIEGMKKSEERLREDMKLVENLKGLDFDLQLLKSLRKTFVVVGKIGGSKLDILRNELGTFRTYLHHELGDDNRIILFILGLKSEEEGIRKVLMRHDFEFFEVDGFEGKPLELLREKQKELEWLRRRKYYLLKKRAEIIREWWDDIEKVYFVLMAQRDRLKALNMLRETKYVSVLEGWVPEKYEWRVQKALDEATSKRVYLVFEDVEDAPTELENPGFVKKFETIIEGFGLPGYRDVDPTPLMAFLFPLFFGFMLGDVFYGLLILLLSFSMRLYFKNRLSNVFSGILMVCGVSAILWGFLFGNFLGNFLGARGLWFEPTRAPLMLIIISLAVGLVHVNVGIVLSVIQKIRRRESVLQEISWFLIEAGGLIMVLKLFGLVGGFLFYYGVVVFIAGLVMKVSRPIKMIGLMSFFGNILSYVRLAAISLATSYIALTVNHITTVFANFSLLLSGFVFGLGHLFNCAISSVGAFINSLRLHYVEFFSQFFGGGGRKFKPLKYEGIEVR